MSFVSSVFLISFIIITAVYFLCPVRIRWVVLLGASLVLYGRADLRYLPFLLCSALVSFFAARLIGRRYTLAEEQAKGVEKQEARALRAAAKKSACRIMIVTLVIVIGLLCYTKFARQVLSLAEKLSSGRFSFSDFQVLVPLGISYYTFSAVGYVLDVYWKRYPAENNFLKYLLYLVYFPHIVQGPIPRYDRLAPQLTGEHRFDYDRVCFGAQLMLWGFFLKLVIADRVSMYVNYAYGSIPEQAGSVLLFATILYAVQIYTDFSGCVNIAKGMSQIFGITLDDNFHQPYFASSVEEFWRRWHITLGSWFRDYLCMPVTVSGKVKQWSKNARKKWGKRAGQNVTTLAALVAVWICTGIWHGTGMNYMLWALWQGGIIAMSVLLEPTYERVRSRLHIRDNSQGLHLFRVLRTFILTGIIPRIFVRSGSVSASGQIIARILTAFAPGQFYASLSDSGMSKVNWAIAFLAVCLLFVISLLRERGVRIRETVAARNIVIRWILYMGLLYVVIIFGKYGPGYDAKSFIYADF